MSTDLCFPCLMHIAVLLYTCKNMRSKLRNSRIELSRGEGNCGVCLSYKKGVYPMVAKVMYTGRGCNNCGLPPHQGSVMDASNIRMCLLALRIE